MEEIEEKIRVFFDVGDGCGSGDGYGCGDGCGYGNGDGSGSGNGYGNGDGSGYGNGYGSGKGSGDGDGSGKGYSSGKGYGYGSGYCECSDDGYGYGKGYGYVNGKRAYMIDNIQTIITAVHGNVAKGAIFNDDFTFTPCYVVKGNGKFAHGRTLHEAFTSLQEKLYDDSTEDERLEAFKSKFPEIDTPYSNADLYAYHHVLTGSCRMGRDNFKEQHGLSLDGTMSVREFVELTKNAYGGDIVKKLPKMYGYGKR